MRPAWPPRCAGSGISAESRRIGNALAHKDGGSVATYRQMIRHMDDGIGRIVAALRATRQIDDTLIVFTADNGGERFSDNWPLVGQKMDLLEGGIRVPLIAHWPARITPSGRCGSRHHDEHRQQRALRNGAWKYLARDGHEYLFDLSLDERERANQALRRPERLVEMRQQWERWAATLPVVPADAAVSLVCGPEDMPALS